jgi:hypothetical protein
MLHVGDIHRFTSSVVLALVLRSIHWTKAQVEMLPKVLLSSKYDALQLFEVALAINPQ